MYESKYHAELNPTQCFVRNTQYQFYVKIKFLYRGLATHSGQFSLYFIDGKRADFFKFGDKAVKSKILMNEKKYD